MIAAGLRRLATALALLALGTSALSATIGAAAGIPTLRAVSGGLLLVGSLLFTAGVLTGLRDPARARRGGRPSLRGARAGGLESWSDAFHLSVVLVGLGLCLVLLGVVLHPRATL